MKSCDELVVAVRGDTHNEDTPNISSRLGIPDSDVVRYLNYGQEKLQSVILKTNPGSFQQDIVINCVPNQEQYTVQDRVFSGERIINVQYSPDGQDRNYKDLVQLALNNRISTNAYGYHPEGYIRRSSSILLCPPPAYANAKVRISYERQADTLALRNGTIGSASGNNIVLSTVSLAQEDYFVANTYICVSKFDGTVLLYNGLISSYNTISDTIILQAAVSTYLVAGYTVADLAGGYVTIGKYTTTHSKLSDICERYLEVYAGMKMFMRDSGNDATDFRAELDSIQEDILQTYQDAYRDEMNIQIVDPSMILRDGWGS